MSNATEYLLLYECQPYVPPTPMEKDTAFLNSMDDYIHEIKKVEDFIYYVYSWSPLFREHLDKLSADQIMEKQSCHGYWTVIR